jgi:hypothetical protein
MALYIIVPEMLSDDPNNLGLTILCEAITDKISIAKKLQKSLQAESDELSGDDLPPDDYTIYKLELVE